MWSTRAKREEKSNLNFSINKGGFSELISVPLVPLEIYLK